jgi:hypothetical protein
VESEPCCPHRTIRPSRLVIGSIPGRDILRAISGHQAGNSPSTCRDPLLI